MNEVREIVDAFDDATSNGQRCALATVVLVEGSSYRRPGARMLICEGGAGTGTISAGCLEADVIEHAKRVIKKGVPKLITYDTASTSDEMAWGLGLGCDGIVQVLIVPLAPGSPYIELLRSFCDLNAAPVLVGTVYQETASRPLRDAAPSNIGGRVYIYADGAVKREKLSTSVATAVERTIREVVEADIGPDTRRFDSSHGGLKVFIEVMMPPVHLIVFGAGNDALPVIHLAHNLGWTAEVVDPQARFASLSRFALASRVILAHPDEVGAQVTVTERTLTLLMSHNYTQDLELLRFLVGSPARYIGIMGSRRRSERLLAEVGRYGAKCPAEKSNLSRLHYPVGLDIGSDSPAEIAVSIIAEMCAVIEGRRGGMLREGRGFIHACHDIPPSVLLGSEQVLPAAVA